MIVNDRHSSLTSLQRHLVLSQLVCRPIYLEIVPLVYGRKRLSSSKTALIGRTTKQQNVSPF